MAKTAKSKAKTVFICQQCGNTSVRWMGRCPDCGEWNSMVETVVEPEVPAGRRAGLAPSNTAPQPLPEIPEDGYTRIPVSMGEMSRVLGGGIVPGSAVLMGGDPGIGKCLAGDTRVLDPLSGAYLPITQWAAECRPVLAIDEETLKFAPAAVSYFHERGVHPVVEITTRLGRTLRCTPDHPVLTPAGWTAVKELVRGSRLATPRALPYFGSKALPEVEVKLIAYILSDGSAQNAISVTTELDEVAEDLRQIADVLEMSLMRYPKKANRASQYRFTIPRGERARARQEVAEALWTVQKRIGISWADWARRADVSYGLLAAWRYGECVPDEIALAKLADAAGVSVHELGKDGRNRAAAVTPAAHLLEKYGVRFSKAADKSVPGCIFRLPPAQLALFLRTLFTCDGSVYVNKNGCPGVSYSTISEHLAQDVQHLMLKYGFVTKLRTKRSTVRHRHYTAYEIQLLGVAETKRFLAEIGIEGRTDAKERIDSMILPGRSSTRTDTVPTGALFWQQLATITDDESFKGISQRAGVQMHRHRDESPLCRSTVMALADAYPVPSLQRLAYNDIYWDEIDRIEPAGEAPVYDLTVPGPANFVANDLIVHNSTLLLQTCSDLAERGGKVLYVSGEESASQIKLRAGRLGIDHKTLYVLADIHVESILSHMETMQPALVVIDSIQAVYSDSLNSAAGSVSQVRESAAMFLRLAKTHNFPLFLVGHVTKEGSIAGPRVLEHMVDVVLYLEGERFHSYRLLRAVKNRFGATDEIGVFEMSAAGMSEVANPSEVFLAERLPNAAGSTIAVTMEGTRPLLVEVQALSSTTSFSMPRRTTNGIDFNRLLLLVAVLSKRVGLRLSDQDVFVNVVGGLRVEEPAADLPIALAIASSFRNVPVAADLAVIGEIGLSGELRAVSQVTRRLNEAAKLGFKRALVPRSSLRKLETPPAGIQVIGVRTVNEAIEEGLDR